MQSGLRTAKIGENPSYLKKAFLSRLKVVTTQLFDKRKDEKERKGNFQCTGSGG